MAADFETGCQPLKPCCAPSLEPRGVPWPSHGVSRVQAADHQRFLLAYSVPGWFRAVLTSHVGLLWGFDLFGRPFQNSLLPGDILSMKHSFVIPKVAFLMHKIGVFITPIIIKTHFYAFKRP